MKKWMMSGVVACLAVACAPRGATQITTPQLNTVGDFTPFEQNRVVQDDISVVLPVGWRQVEMSDGTNVLRSQVVRGATVTIRRVDMSEIIFPDVRPSNCQVHYLTCTPIDSAYVTHYGVVHWQQVVYIDRGLSGVYRVHALWNDGPVGEGIPTLVSMIARSIIRIH